MLKIQLIDILLAAAILTCLFLMAGCSQRAAVTLVPTIEITVPTEAPTEVTAPFASPRLRIKNAGEVDIHNLTVLFPESRITFGDIPAGSTSDYQPAPKGVYNYAAYEYSVNGETVMQPVIDWVGELPRPGLSYTYVLSLDPNRKNAPMIELVEIQADLN
jgi:hypothetical protein